MIRLERVSYSYPGAEKTAIEDISFEIGKGEILGILGPSGAGKSTLQKCIIGLLGGYRGGITFQDMSVGSVAFREQIGVQFEFPNLYESFTAIENLKFFGGFYRTQTRDPIELLNSVGLAEDAAKKVGEYSKGMKMRLSFARAVLHNPSVLFLDEPTSGLDPVYADQLMTLIENEKRRGVTVFLTTHNMQVAARLADRLAFIVDGKLPLIDTPKALIHSYGEDIVRMEYEKEGISSTEDFRLSTLGSDEKFMEILKTGTPVSIHSQEASLDKVFAKVTGRRLNGSV